MADWVKNLIEKKWPSLSDSDMVTGGLKFHLRLQLSTDFLQSSANNNLTPIWQKFKMANSKIYLKYLV